MSKTMAEIDRSETRITLYNTPTTNLDGTPYDRPGTIMGFGNHLRRGAASHHLHRILQVWDHETRSSQDPDRQFEEPDEVTAERPFKVYSKDHIVPMPPIGGLVSGRILVEPPLVQSEVQALCNLFPEIDECTFDARPTELIDFRQIIVIKGRELPNLGFGGLLAIWNNQPAA